MKTYTEKELKTRARYAMRYHLQDDPLASYTVLAENAAILLDHDEWLDNPDHWIWDIALQEGA